MHNKAVLYKCAPLVPEASLPGIEAIGMRLNQEVREYS